MPFIDVKTSAAITPAQEESLKRKLGKAISLIPGKSESWLMLSLSGDMHMYFQGTNAEPCAMAEIKLFGAASAAAYDKLTTEVTAILGSELKVPANRVFVKYEEVKYWGWNGNNF